MARKAVHTEAKKTDIVNKPAEEVKQEAVKAAEEGEKKVQKKAAKALARKSEIKTSICVQYLGKEIYEKDMVALVKKAWTAKKNKISDIKSIELYVKPEDNAVYYVVNGDFTGSVEI